MNTDVVSYRIFKKEQKVGLNERKWGMRRRCLKRSVESSVLQAMTRKSNGSGQCVCVELPLPLALGVAVEVLVGRVNADRTDCGTCEMLEDPPDASAACMRARFRVAAASRSNFHRRAWL